MTSDPAINIRHEPGARRFVADAGAHQAVLDYGVVNPRVWDFRRTFVPPPARGRGIASRLVKHALEHARTHGLRVVPTCSFVATYIEAHPEYEPLRAGDG